MKKWIRFSVFVLMFSSASLSYGNKWSDIIGLLKQIAEANSGMQFDLDHLNDVLTRLSDWGTRDFVDDHSWEGATRWQDALHGGTGPLGQTIQALSQEFPIDTAVYNKSNPNESDQKYYALHAKTALTARAASQFSYNTIQDQINYAKQLKDQINHAEDLKQSLDLQSRLVAENNLIQLEILRQLAISNQQKAIEAQGVSEDMAQLAHFLSRE
jgi:hypothetical protein